MGYHEFDDIEWRTRVPGPTGRPSILEAGERFTVRLPKEMREWLASNATRRRTSSGALIRVLLDVGRWWWDGKLKQKSELRCPKCDQ